MIFTDFINNISHLQNGELGGQPSQFKLAPKLRLQFSEEDIKERNPKLASVLAVFYPDEKNQTRFLVTERASYNGTHSAQISFPGGKMDKGDTSLQETALREAEEEVGIPPSEVKIIREMSKNYIPPSNFMVSPFMGYASKHPKFKSNYEVATIIEVLLSDLLDDRNLSTINVSTSYMSNINVPCFILNNYTIWGATAMILSEIKDLIKANFVH